MSQDHEPLQAMAADAGGAVGGQTAPTRPTLSITLRLNGQERQVNAPPMRRLLDVLRENLGLTGTKEGCGEGECGACTVLIDGKPVNSCLVPVCQVDGSDVVTVEGLAKYAILHPVQEAFLQHGGAQCGICTPGMAVTAAWLVDSGQPAERIRELLAGNLCRCTGYGPIVDSVQAAVEGAQARRKA